MNDAQKAQRAKALYRRALANYAKFLQAGSVGKSALEALARYERQWTEADALLDGIAQ